MNISHVLLIVAALFVILSLMPPLPPVLLHLGVLLIIISQFV